MNWERVRTVDGETKYVRNPVEIKFLGQPALTGMIVNKEDEEVAPRGVDEVRWLVTLDCIKKRTPVYMDFRYGTLEEKKDLTPETKIC